MQEHEMSWIKLLIAVFFGSLIIGYLITKLLKYFITTEPWVGILGFITPACVLIALALVLFAYNKDKEDTL